VRILDKYLLREYAWPLLYCFDVFAMLMIVIDLFGTLDEFIQNHARIGTVVHYYLILFPEMFVIIMPMALLLGLLFCLANLSKYNELVAMRVSGISLMRLAVPLLAIGAAATIAVFVVNELFVPHAHEKADALRAHIKGRGQPDVLENFFFANTVERRDWYARRFNTRRSEMETVEVHGRKDNGDPDFDVYAESARWIDRQWHFFNADVYDHRRNELPRIQRITRPSRRRRQKPRRPDHRRTPPLYSHSAGRESPHRAGQVRGQTSIPLLVPPDLPHRRAHGHTIGNAREPQRAVARRGYGADARRGVLFP
jgi:lipopolysaccharide export LptBFGC system permease protein LptF